MKPVWFFRVTFSSFFRDKKRLYVRCENQVLTICAIQCFTVDVFFKLAELQQQLRKVQHSCKKQAIMKYTERKINLKQNLKSVMKVTLLITKKTLIILVVYQFEAMLSLS